MSFKSYLEGLRAILDRIEREQVENIEQAGSLIADALAAGAVAHVFGTGHSHLIAGVCAGSNRLHGGGRN